jgi:carbon monoxide dehydrogenase subunit G
MALAADDSGALRCDACRTMRTWTATTTVDARPEAVLAILTDPEACRRWAPFAFDVDDVANRLSPGSRARVTGRLAGRSVDFEVEIHEADDHRLILSAQGPVGFDVRYDLAPAARGSEVRASVSVRPEGGLAGRVLAQATQAMLAAGALDTAVARIAREAVLGYD